MRDHRGEEPKTTKKKYNDHFAQIMFCEKPVKKKARKQAKMSRKRNR